MSTAEGKGKREVTSVAVNSQRPTDARDCTVVESTQVGGEHSPPQMGGVQKVGDFLNGELQYFPENNAASVQKVGDLLNVYDENRPAVAAANHLIRRSAAAPDDHIRTFRESLPAPTPAGRMGRPKTMTSALLEQICLLLSIGFSRRQAAAYLGISPGSITNAVSRDPALGDELRQAEELQALQPELTIMAEARRNWRAAAWYLNFKSKQKQNVTDFDRSEEEKEQRHQAKLADQRREAELTRQDLLNMGASIRAAEEADRAAKKSPPRPIR